VPAGPETAASVVAACRPPRTPPAQRDQPLRNQNRQTHQDRSQARRLAWRGQAARHPVLDRERPPLCQTKTPPLCQTKTPPQAVLRQATLSRIAANQPLPDEPTQSQSAPNQPTQNQPAPNQPRLTPSQNATAD
jgi:hypothetical protein